MKNYTINLGKTLDIKIRRQRGCVFLNLFKISTRHTKIFRVLECRVMDTGIVYLGVRYSPLHQAMQVWLITANVNGTATFRRLRGCAKYAILTLFKATDNEFHADSDVFSDSKVEKYFRHQIDRLMAGERTHFSIFSLGEKIGFHV